jgi:EAL domain-containing protein (putative c-di-GMP-specific phosphodiesterase class I)
LTVVAEGVEPRPQFDILRRLGCDEVQGYYFSAPVPFEQATVLLQESSVNALPVSNDATA